MFVCCKHILDLHFFFCPSTCPISSFFQDTWIMHIYAVFSVSSCLEITLLVQKYYFLSIRKWMKISVWMEFPEELTLIGFSIKLILFVKMWMLRTAIKLFNKNPKNNLKKKIKMINKHVLYNSSSCWYIFISLHRETFIT